MEPTHIQAKARVAIVLTTMKILILILIEIIIIIIIITIILIVKIGNQIWIFMTINIMTFIKSTGKVMTKLTKLNLTALI